MYYKIQLIYHARIVNSVINISQPFAKRMGAYNIVKNPKILIFYNETKISNLLY